MLPLQRFTVACDNPVTPFPLPPSPHLLPGCCTAMARVSRPSQCTARRHPSHRHAQWCGNCPLSFPPISDFAFFLSLSLSLPLFLPLFLVFFADLPHTSRQTPVDLPWRYKALVDNAVKKFDISVDQSADVHTGRPDLKSSHS
jgi:hypothetical protein